MELVIYVSMVILTLNNVITIMHCMQGYEHNEVPFYLQLIRCSQKYVKQPIQDKSIIFNE